MRWAIGVLLAAAWASAAVAAIPPPGSTEPTRRVLARQVVMAMGGSPRVEPLMQGALNRVLPAFPSVQDTPEKRKALQAIIPGVKQDFSVLVPKLVEISIDSYATVLTEQELRDYLAFLNSPSGKSITQKGPLIARQAASAESPMIKAAMPGLMIKMADRICKVGSCKPEERARFRAEMDKAFPGSRR